jgi:hypothetical protein
MVLHVDVNVTIFNGVGASDLQSRLRRIASRHVSNHNLPHRFLYLLLKTEPRAHAQASIHFPPTLTLTRSLNLASPLSSTSLPTRLSSAYVPTSRFPPTVSSREVRSLRQSTSNLTRQERGEGCIDFGASRWHRAIDEIVRKNERSRRVEVVFLPISRSLTNPFYSVWRTA